MFFITEFSLSPPLIDGVFRDRVVYKKCRRNNFISSRATLFYFFFSPPIVRVPRDLQSPSPSAIQFQTEQPYLRRTNHYASVCARYTPGVHRWFLIYTRISRVWGRQRRLREPGRVAAEGEGEGWKGAHAAALIFSPRYATANYSAYMLAHCESVERWRSITASEVEPLCQFA